MLYASISYIYLNMLEYPLAIGMIFKIVGMILLLIPILKHALVMLESKFLGGLGYA